jgi:hypothetical protein
MGGARTLTMGVMNSTRKLGMVRSEGKKWSRKLMIRPLMCEPSWSCANTVYETRTSAPRRTTHLIGHDHEMAVPELVGARVDLVVLEAHDLLDGLDLGVVDEGLATGVADVEELAAQGKDAPIVATDDAQAGDGERLGRVTLGEDEGALLGVAAAGVVGVLELGQTGDALAFAAVGLLKELCGRVGRCVR